MAGPVADPAVHASLAAQLREPIPWDDAWLERLMARHFAWPDGSPRPIPVAVPAHRSPTLCTGATHIGFGLECISTLAAMPELLRTDEALVREAMMAVDWTPVSSRARLDTLRDLRTPEKSGLDWLTGFDRGMPSFHSLRSWGDRLAWLVVVGVGRYYEAKDRWRLRRLEQAMRRGDARGIHQALAGLAFDAAKRGVKIGYVIPRLVLLRQSARELQRPDDLAFASIGLAEIARQYDEYAPDDARSAHCCRVALSFAMEAARTPHGRGLAAGFLEQLLRSALARGFHRDQLMPLLF